MTKPNTLLLDFDGVISQSRYFSEIYSKTFNVPLHVLMPFFDNMKDTLNIGKGDLREVLKDVVDAWQWKGTVDELVSFWFNSDCNIDSRIVNLVLSLRRRGIVVYLATDQEKYRADYLWNKQNLKDWLDGKFVSCDLGFPKGNPNFFIEAVKKLDVHPNEIVFFDDSESKVESAKKVGIRAYQFKSYEGFENKVKKLFL